MALTTSSDLCCNQCKVPVAAPSSGELNAFECNTFIDSMVKSSAKANEGDVNRMVKCDGCGEEDATMHCVDCNEHIGPSCLVPHRKMKATASHQQMPLEEALTGNTIKRIPPCQKHFGYEVNTYCKTCSAAVCAMCVVEKHPKHDFFPLSQVTCLLQDQIAGYTITIGKREWGARKAITTLDGNINKIEEHRSIAEKEIAKIFDVVAASVEERRVQILQQMHDKGDHLRKTTLKEKGEAESATIEFREFRTFTEGLLAQGTPLEIAATHKMVRA